ncbi:AMP-binding protein [Shinella daejeonensis]|uniref:class I adenylate-forming enzyme family protein n=1 Tax=Shinella daejeonensis TaxID=659017 RepID=UPI0020C802D3|nr:AMP-binding protein [Shinella daejeonensis]MCP8897461.1 AMP-binding protein [Shinella daejeonensis]
MPDCQMPQNVFIALRDRMSPDPGRTALVFENEYFSFEDVVALSENAARHLMRLGIAKGDRVAAIAQNRPEMLLLYYAAARIGAIYVPMNPNLSESELKYALAHSGARMLFHDEVSGDGVAAAIPVERRRPIDLLNEPAGGVDLPAASAVMPDDDFLIIYTSGTTGQPKAILLTHAAQVGVARALAEMWDLGRDDVTLVTLPLGFLYGLSTGAAVGLQAGGKVVLLRRFHPRDALEALVAHRITIYHGVPTMYSMMLEFCEQQDKHFDLSNVREIICAGAPLPLEMRRRFATRFGKSLQNYYAMTEATPVFGHYSRDDEIVPEGSVGKAAPGLSYRIVRPDGSDCAPGEQGEFLVRAAATVKEYYGAPEQTAGAMVDDYFRSGDLGHRDENGFFFITGRIKDIIIRGGANISPSEVEEALISHPAVQDVSVVGGADRIFGEVPVAFVIRRAGADVSVDELVAHAESRLADFKVPRTVRFIDTFPLGKTGKVDKAALKTMIGSE